jgi:Bor protein
MKRIVLILALATAGCWRMTVRNGNPAGETPIEYDDRWHHGIAWGLAELSGPYDLSRICPRGWAEIHTETPFVQGLVQALALHLYNPQSVTVRCSAR